MKINHQNLCPPLPPMLQVSSTCTTSRACPLPGFSQDDTMRGTLYASCDASPCTAGLGSLRAGAPQDCNLPGTPAIIRCCTPRAKVRCAQQHACTWVAPRIMDLEIQRRTIIPGCRVKSFWGQLLASKAQTNTVLQSIVAMAPAVTRFLRRCVWCLLDWLAFLRMRARLCACSCRGLIPEDFLPW